ncbi:MAG: hypothetical protein ACI4PO_09720, partial [Faecousia sp.]
LSFAIFSEVPKLDYDSKSVCGQPHVGSNPTVSARKKHFFGSAFLTKSTLSVGETCLRHVKALRRWM